VLARFRKHLSYANVVATLALFVALGGTAAAAGVIVHSNSDVAKDTISGHKAPTGDHPNLIAGSVAAKDLSASLFNALKSRCPTGTQKAFDLCYERDMRPPAGWDTAVSICANAALRLPSAAEMAEVFQFFDTDQVAQWVDSFFQNGTSSRAVALSRSNTGAVYLATDDSTDDLPYRCIVGLHD
jgi:hypothetical protein